MIRPSFQFYPADWRNNAKLRRCSEGARGAWMDVLCVLHDSDEYGVCRWPLADLARAAGVPVKYLKELVEKDVLKGGDKGCDPYIYTPVSGRVQGAPVTLVHSEEGKPVWYCSRFVRDEYIRQRRGNATQFSADNQPQKVSPNPSPKVSPKGGIGERQGDGSSSSSSSSSSISKLETSSLTPTIPEGDDDTPRQPGEWFAWFNRHHGTQYDATSLHDRKKLMTIFAQWCNSGVTPQQVNEAVKRAYADAKEPISNLAAYVDRVLSSMTSQKQPQPAIPKSGREQVAHELWGTQQQEDGRNGHIIDHEQAADSETGDRKALPAP